MPDVAPIALLQTPSPSTGGRRPWLDHWLETCADLSALTATHPMMDAVIDEVDGRMIRIGDRWLADFASCNYLGFDLDPEIIASVLPQLETWGTHPSWSRLLGSPVLCEEIETRLTALLGSEDSLVLPTITHIHMSVIPLLAASGTIFLDARAHKTIYDGCQVARARGAAVRRFRFEDPDHLDALLRAEADPTRLVCMDGVNSMTGNAPDLPAFAEVARRHGALLYVDDAHGFGVIGERSPDESSSYGVARQQHRPPRRRELRRRRARRRLLEGVLVAAGVHRLPDRGQAAAEGRGRAVPVLRAFAGRLARHRAGRLRRQRAARRRPARHAARPHRPRPLRPVSGSTCTRPTTPGCRSSRSRCATTGGSTPSGACCSSAASTSRSPPTRSSPRTRSASASSSRRPTPSQEVDRLIVVLEELADRGELRSPSTTRASRQRIGMNARARRCGRSTSRSARSLCVAVSLRSRRSRAAAR